MSGFIETWKRQVIELKIQVYALYLVYRDSRVPWYARFFAACVVGYAFSPIDLIPDFIPILGYLDDLIIIPLGITLALKMVPVNVLNECQVQSRELIQQGKPVNRVAAAIIVVIWIGLAFLAFRLALDIFAW